MTEEAEVSPDFEDAFAALYPPDVAQLRRTRALAMRDLRAELRALAGTQQQIADKLGIKQPRLNKILRGDAAAISLDNLVQLAARVGLHAELVFTKRGDSSASSFESALAQADRHCDMEGLPAAGEHARKLGQKVAEGSISPDEAVRALVEHHKQS
ncbi:MAG: XRE family transcriptional regulator [Polycyclovorans sp.]|nr:XRE family transcriptional regulator [Polycyclovorans sp.]